MATEEELRRNAELMRQSTIVATPGYAEAEQQREAQQSIFANIGDAFESTTLMKTIKRVGQEYGPLSNRLREQGWGANSLPLAAGAALLGIDVLEPDYDREKYAPELTQGVPVEYWEDILKYSNLDAARRERSRILSTIARTERMALQKGAASTIAMIAGGFLDIDAPLILASGGMVGGAKVARSAYKMGRVMGMSGGAALRTASVAQGIGGGVQAAAIVSGGEHLVDPTAGWDDFLVSVTMGAGLGGTLGAFLTGDTRRIVDQMRDTTLRNKVMGDERDLPSFNEIDEAGYEGVFTFDDPIDTSSAPGPSVPGSDQQSIGAARTPYGAVTLSSPYRHSIAAQDKAIIQRFSDWLDVTGSRLDLVDAEETVVGRIMTGAWVDANPQGIIEQGLNIGKKAVTGMVNLGARDVMYLAKSKGNVNNGLFLNIFENPSAYGRGIGTASTASTLKTTFESRLGSIAMRYDHPSSGAAVQWARKRGYTYKVPGVQGGLGITEEGKRALGRDILLSLNDIRMGRTPNLSDPDFAKAVAVVQENFAEALSIMKGRDPQTTSVRGLENIATDAGYFRQRLMGPAIKRAIDSGKTNRALIEEAMAKGYIAAGMPPKVADVVAKANVARALNNELDIDTSLVDILSEDGREFLKQRLDAMGMPANEVNSIMQALTGIKEERGRAGFTKHRNDLDISIQITTLDGSNDFSLVDLMDHDMGTMMAHYNRQAAGAAALARKGIRSRTELDQVISAARVESEALGEEVKDTDWYKAMFSEFYGVRWGYTKGFGANKGVDPYTTIARDAASISLLQQVGFAQLIDAANGMAAHGMVNYFRGLTRVIKGQDQQVMDDLRVLLGNIGHDQHIFRQHRHFDELNAGDERDLIRGIRRFGENLSFIQGYTSLFNAVRRREQETNALLLANKVLVNIKNNVYTDRMKMDLGIDDNLYNQLSDLIQRGVIEFRTEGGKTIVDRLNPEQWDYDDFASVMMRGQYQIVQGNLIGEQSLWMRTGAGSVVAQFKSFPLTALPKQFIRNFRHGPFDAEAWATVTYGIGMAYVALTLRDVINNRDRSDVERAKSAIAYSNTLGWVPMVYDPVMTLMGLSSMRMEAFGNRYSFSIPAVDTVDRAFAASSGLAKLVRGDDYTREERNALKLFPGMNILGLGEWLLPNP